MVRLEIDHPVDGRLEVKYGLPGKVEFCKRCVISNQRPNSSVEFLVTEDSPKTTIRLDDDGICDAGDTDNDNDGISDATENTSDGTGDGIADLVVDRDIQMFDVDQNAKS